MFKKWFGNKTNHHEEVIMAPLNGEVIPLEQVPDPTFSEKMLGDGVAIVPRDGLVVSPVKGEVVQLFSTKHAIGIRSEKGLEILIHVGLETVSMNGEGFESYVSKGDRVTVGQPVIRFSLETVRENAKSTITPIVITNPEFINSIQIETNKEVRASETPIMMITMKE